MTVRTDRRFRGFLCKNIVTLVLLIGALVLVGLAASYSTPEQLGNLPAVVINTLRSVAGAI